MTQKPTTQLWNSKKKKKIMPLAQIAPPSLVRARLRVNLWVQDPLNMYVIMSKKKNVHLYHKIGPISRKFQQSCGVLIKKKKKKTNYAA